MAFVTCDPALLDVRDVRESLHDVSFSRVWGLHFVCLATLGVRKTKGLGGPDTGSPNVRGGRLG